MKTPANPIVKILMTCFLMLSFNTLLPYTIKGTHKPDTSEVEIGGKINQRKKIFSGSYKVELIHFGVVVESTIVKGNKSFKFLLKKNTAYDIRISKKGFVPRIVSVNTKVKDQDITDIAYSFFFEVALIGAKEARNLDSEALELPVDIISYNKNTGSFDNNKDYKSFVNQRLYASADVHPF